MTAMVVYNVKQEGIGRAIAKMLVTCGAKVYALSRTQSDLDSLKEEVPGISTLTVDLVDWDATTKAVESIGPVDLLVNNAGFGIVRAFIDVTQEEFDETLNINLKAAMHVGQIVARSMISKGTGGSIVNISSQASLMALTGHAAYSASKAGLDMLTKTMALELATHKIRVNSVNPTVVLTELGKRAWADPVRSESMTSRIPMNKFAEVKDVVNAVIYLLSDKADMITGSCLPIDGGFVVAGV
uniref:L-xylulose reductase-like n=1 Tax=Saccoglossus kowalevskii TaxID=10224 RepID=A0ABM0GYV3_SACKO|nr:PREDICTED: L-xylulose reductase-like [Saccoglossus kowalevskii]